MLVRYVQAAMRKAKYEILREDHTYFGKMPNCQGVWANAKTLENCREELQSVLEDWILVRVRHAMKLPIIHGIDMNPRITKQQVA
jgi:predicted RNase H-like HicB family nuclease